MNVSMKIHDVFYLADRAILVGDLEADVRPIQGVRCAIEVDNQRVAEVVIEGEVRTGKPNRDLWTFDSIGIDAETVRGRDVWLKSL